MLSAVNYHSMQISTDIKISMMLKFAKYLCMDGQETVRKLGQCMHTYIINPEIVVSQGFMELH